MKAENYEQSSKPIPDEKLDLLHETLKMLTNAFGGIRNTQQYFILPILASVCALFDGDARILTKEKVVGKLVYEDATFDFVLQRGSTRVCVIEAKRDDFQQGLALAYVGGEIFAEVEGLPAVHCIVTNFVEWYFLRSLADKVEQTTPITISMEGGIPTRESVKGIAERIYAMLSEDN